MQILEYTSLRAVHPADPHSQIYVGAQIKKPVSAPVQTFYLDLPGAESFRNT